MTQQLKNKEKHCLKIQNKLNYVFECLPVLSSVTSGVLGLDVEGRVSFVKISERLLGAEHSGKYTYFDGCT